MFLRFRKLLCDGFRPWAVSETAIACRRPWRGIPCRGHCHAKPRCRWRIGKEEKLAPYRLKVVLVENKRVNGKVKQETIAVLGSIEATLLPEFWEGVTPERAAELKTDKWELYSLKKRIAFWKIANRRMKKLSNRLGPDAKRIRMAAHARVPWPMEAGKNRLELLETKKNLDFYRDHAEWLQKNIEMYEETIKRAEQDLAEGKKRAYEHSLGGAEAAAKLAKLSARRP